MVNGYARQRHLVPNRFCNCSNPASETPKTETLRMTIPESGAASLRVAKAMDDLLHAHRAPASTPTLPPASIENQIER
jgi:hypothetical protein